VFAGKAHPRDDDAKRVAQLLFSLRGEPTLGAHAAFVENYDLSFAATLVAGCDVWLNLPRPPLEASGTSGMKAALNGCLNVSVLDGWWCEAFTPEIGWAIEGAVDHDDDARDRRDSDALFDLLEREVVPLFSDRDGSGVPVAWVERIKAALAAIGPQYCSVRVGRDYEREAYARSRAG
jgi:glycogen phosphorylase